MKGNEKADIKRLLKAQRAAAAYFQIILLRFYSKLFDCVNDGVKEIIATTITIIKPANWSTWM